MPVDSIIDVNCCLSADGLGPQQPELSRVPHVPALRRRVDDGDRYKEVQAGNLTFLLVAHFPIFLFKLNKYYNCFKTYSYLSL